MTSYTLRRKFITSASMTFSGSTTQNIAIYDAKHVLFNKHDWVLFMYMEGKPRFSINLKSLNHTNTTKPEIYVI